MAATSFARLVSGQAVSRYTRGQARERAGLMTDADAYRAALERATYQDAGNQYGQGLTGISNFLARSGPLADSGAATALRTRLASQIYGAASGRIQGGYASYLANLLNQNRAYNYQRQLMAYQKKLNKRGVLQSITGAVGGFLGATHGGGQTEGGV